MIQIQENGEKPNFDPDFGLFGPNFFYGFYLLDARHCFKLSLCVTPRKTYVPNPRKRQITSFWV